MRGWSITGWLILHVRNILHSKLALLLGGEVVANWCSTRYFLITPKLLANLTYHPRMKVHTINSGDYVEEDYKIDVMKCIAKMRALGAGRA